MRLAKLLQLLVLGALLCAGRVGDEPLAERLLPLAIGLGMYVLLRG